MEGRGIIVTDVQKELKVERDNAEKILQTLKNLKLIVPLDTRLGKMKQYALANYTHVLSTKTKLKQEILPNDISLILARELSNREYVYHNIHLETSLNYKEDYNQLDWPIPSKSNKQKVHTFRLGLRRSCTFTVSPSGHVSISIECTLQPFEFHTSSGLISFFVTCGQILNLLQLSAKNRSNVVPLVEDWRLTQFDYNKDISVDKLPKVISWSSKGILKVEYLGTIFQIYCKEMPFDGEHLRAEGHYSTKEKTDLQNMIANLADAKRHPFVTVEEMLFSKNHPES